MAAIELDHVTKEFPDGTRAVDDVELEIVDGEFMIFVGPSGCGKTTALRMVAGLEKVTSGEIRIGGHVVNDLDPVDRDVAMVFQNYALYPHMTVRDNIGFPLKMQGFGRRESDGRITAAARPPRRASRADSRPRAVAPVRRRERRLAARLTSRTSSSARCDDRAPDAELGGDVPGSWGVITDPLSAPVGDPDGAVAGHVSNVRA